jgi:MFS family permease
LSSEKRLWLAVLALGVTQIVGYGTLYYAYSILAASVAADFDVAPSAMFGAFSAGMLAGGLAAPRLGVLMDRLGAPRVMTLGSLAAAAALAGLASAPNFPVFAVLVVATEIVAVAVCYDAAFATLVLFGGAKARGAITRLTLIAGFASTLFWPLTGALDANFGWRTTLLIFAGLHVAVALPLHLWLAAQARNEALAANDAKAPAAAPAAAQLRPQDERFAFWAVGISFALSGMVIAAMGVHMVPVLSAMGLGASAYIVSMLMGPTQVAIRLTDALFWRSLHPLQVATISGLALPLSVVALMLPIEGLVAGALFAAATGVGQGLSSIVRGTVPLALFGSAGYAARLGRLAAVRTVLSASAPFLFALGMQEAGLATTLWIAFAIGVVALLPLLMLMARLKRVAA